MNKSLLFLLLLLSFACERSDSELPDTAAVAQQIDELGETDRFSGVLIIATEDSVLLRKAYGYANVERKTPITENTRFNLASMNKLFTAATIMRLRDAGALSLNDTVRSFLPDYPNPAVRDQVTIEQLLTHTSGLGDMFTPAFEQADPNTIRGLDDYLNKFVDEPLRFPPGAEFAYSNAGYIVLGLIIESITGRDYYAYLQEDLFQPLGMDNTGWYQGDSLYNTVATAYGELDSAGVRQENPYLVMKGSSAGGGYSSAADLLKYARALVKGEVVSLETLREMREDRFDNGYGYGLSLREMNGQAIYGHNGGFPGVSGEVDIYPAKGLFAISLSNRSPRDGWASARSVVRNAIVGITEESAGVLNADELVSIYESEGLPAALTAAENMEGPIEPNQIISASERYDNTGAKEQAIELLTLCLAVDPDNWFPVSIKADLQLQTGDTLAAISGWQRSLELNPDNQWAKDRLAEYE